ncbi:MAG TPA: hypothetical protein VK524_11640, partial [Polyangiaceae bacterium]|nr:hypothetical protein [Polyangiaceae bacterium]
MLRTTRAELMARCLGLTCLGLASAACGSSDDDDEPTDTREWRTIISGEWSMPESKEGYSCVRQTIQEDLIVNGFEAIIPLGTHHTLLTMGEPNAPDGLAPCTAGTNRTLSVFGSGVGTNPLIFPPGVAMRIPAGMQLLLNLHLFNTGRGELTGLSGTRISTVDESQVEHWAKGVLAGEVRFSLPPGQITTTTGYCTMDKDVTIFAVAP